MKRCVMTQSAVETIQKESLSAFEIGKETGGILIGPAPTDETVVITSATGPGPDGERASSASWETEPEYLNEMLKRAREENPRANLRGFWHRHPGRMTHPSGQDLMEARNILADKEHYKLDGKLIMPIVTATRRRIAIHCHCIGIDDPHFREIPMVVVSDEDEMVKSSLSGRKVIEMEEGADFKFWQDGDWQFYKTSYGAARLEEELEGLKFIGYKVTARLLSDGSCCIEAWKDGSRQQALFLLPREYPINPPQVFVKYDEDIQELRTDDRSPLCRWSSMFYLSELVSVLGNQLSKRTGRGRIRLEVLAAIKEDFRRGNCSISKLLQRTASLIRGKEKCNL